MTASPSDPVLQTLIDKVRDAAVHDRPLCIRGGGTKDFLGGPLIGEKLDLRALSGISSYEPTELVVTVRAGTPLAELEAALAERGQCLPFEPPKLAAGGTVGGMVASGLAGPARASAGSVRDYVLGVTLMNGLGKVMSFGGQVMKNVAGYDVSRLMAGSMGTLGVICEVSLKVLPEAPATRTLRFDMEQAPALRLLNELAGQPLPLSASAWWDDILVLRLRGAVAAVEAAVDKLGGEEIEPALAESFWAGLRDQRDEFFVGAQAAVDGGAALWRLSVAPTAPPLMVTGEQLIEWGGGQRWVVTTAIDAIMHSAAAEGKGYATCYRGGDREPTGFGAVNGPMLRLQREVKRSFDPAGIFNRQRLHPSL